MHLHPELILIACYHASIRMCVSTKNESMPLKTMALDPALINTMFYVAKTHEERSNDPSLVQ